jgi:hypothetical protein
MHPSNPIVGIGAGSGGGVQGGDQDSQIENLRLTGGTPKTEKRTPKFPKNAKHVPNPQQHSPESRQQPNGAVQTHWEDEAKCKLLDVNRVKQQGGGRWTRSTRSRLPTCAKTPRRKETTKQRMPTVPCACPLLELRALIDLGRAAALVVKRLSEAQQPWIPRPGRQGTY